ncbi:MAG: TerC family protein [Chloroflexota bacterium]
MSIDTLAWIVFGLLIASFLALDLFVFHREAHEVKPREALSWVCIWVAVALAFCVLLYFWKGPETAGEFLAGYLIEQSLSVDNMFVFALIFGYFAVPGKFQHRLLFWGIVGAVIFRAIFIGAGAVLLKNFHWTIYLFGAFLVYTGLKLLRHNDEEIEPEKNPVLRLIRRFIPMTAELRGQSFFVREGGRWMATPLFAVLVVIETTDVIFAVDSIPAVFAVTSDPFIVFTSNAFAILGLRALYFLLADMMGRFVYLKYGLAAILTLVGTKMLLTDIYKVPVWLSLGAIIAILAVTIFISLRVKPAEESSEPQAAPEQVHH